MLLTIPVIITLLVYMIAGFIIREVSYVGITHIEINYTNAFNAGLMSAGVHDDDRIFDVAGMRVGDQIDLTQIIIVRPDRARFSSLRIEVSYEENIHSLTNAIAHIDGLILDGIIRAVGATTNPIEVRVINDAAPVMTIVIDGILPSL